MIIRGAPRAYLNSRRCVLHGNGGIDALTPTRNHQLTGTKTPLICYTLPFLVFRRERVHFPVVSTPPVYRVLAFTQYSSLQLVKEATGPWKRSQTTWAHRTGLHALLLCLRLCPRDRLVMAAMLARVRHCSPAVVVLPSGAWAIVAAASAVVGTVYTVSRRSAPVYVLIAGCGSPTATNRVPRSPPLPALRRSADPCNYLMRGGARAGERAAEEQLARMSKAAMQDLRHANSTLAGELVRLQACGGEVRALKQQAHTVYSRYCAACCKARAKLLPVN